MFCPFVFVLSPGLAVRLFGLAEVQDLPACYGVAPALSTRVIREAAADSRRFSLLSRGLVR